MTVNDIRIDPAKLMPMGDLLGFLRENGEDDRALAKIRERQYEEYGAEAIWRYPISDGLHLGTFIVPVKEGFISLPYDSVDKHDGELLELGEAALLSADAMQFFIEDWLSFSDDLLSAMRDMQSMLLGG